MADVIFEKCDAGESEVPQGFVIYKVKRGKKLGFSAPGKLLENILKIGREEELVRFRGNFTFGTYYIISKQTNDILCMIHQTPLFMGFLVPKNDPQAGFLLADRAYVATGLSYLVDN
jgi:hypothetical protein